MEEIEIWKDVPDYEGVYMASNLGNVKSLDRRYFMVRNNSVAIKKGKILKPYFNGNDRLDIDLRLNGKRKTLALSQIIAITFLNHIPCGLDTIVDHIDNNPLNNKLSNLQLITNRENCSKDKKNKTSNFAGVHWDKGRLKWKSSIRIKDKEVFLGRFDCELKASEAYQQKLATLN